MGKSGRGRVCENSVLEPESLMKFFRNSSIWIDKYFPPMLYLAELPDGESGKG